MKKILLTCSLILLSKLVLCQCNVTATWTFGSPSPTIYLSGGATGTSGSVFYFWDFGDGNGDSIFANTTHTYASFGTYNVCVSISDSLGCVDTTCYLITLTAPPPGVTINIFEADTAFLYNCTTPHSVPFYYSQNIVGYNSTDTFRFEVRFGDGVDSIYYLPLNASLQGSFMHQYQNAGNYTAQFIVTAPDSLADTAFSQTIIVTSSCGPVSGIVYNDLNGNCTYDSGEELENIPIEIYNGTTIVGWAISDSLGVYSFNVPTGNTYDIHISSWGGMTGHYVPSCPSNGIITVSSLPSSGNDFGVVCPAGFDLQGNVTAWQLRPGFSGTVCVNVYNQRCNTPTGQIELVFDADLTPQPDTSGTYTISGNTVTYPINNSALYWSFCIPVMTSVSAILGDSLCIDISIQPVSGDSVPLNNTGHFCFPVRNSWDPNDKYASPQGDGLQGSIRPNTELTYTIRFQNTGNAEAVNIYILDTLDADLDPQSLEILGSSHDMHWSLLAGNIIRFNFDNINLADSNSNEPASHGYVMYRINEVSNVAHLAQINNTADIYFDFNPPVITNTTLNTVDHFLSVPVIHSSVMSAYPNPASDKCYLYFRNNDSKIISVIDVQGREVYRNKISSDSFILNTAKFKSGIYTINIFNDDKISDFYKLNIIH